MYKFKATCPICKRSAEADKSGEAILAIDHVKKSDTVKCDYYKRLPIDYSGCVYDRELLG